MNSSLPVTRLTPIEYGKHVMSSKANEPLVSLIPYDRMDIFERYQHKMLVTFEIKFVKKKHWNLWLPHS